MSGKLTVVEGDATRPINEGRTTIYLPHCCNDFGGWGSGFVNAITARWGESPRGIYRMWAEGKAGTQIMDRLKERNDPKDGKLLYQTAFVLGGTQLIELPKDIVLVNMVGQHNVGKGELTARSRIKDDETFMDDFTRPPIRYGAMAKAMYALADYIERTHAKDPILRACEIHCPKFGSDLAGGDWNVIEAMIFELWVDRGIDVTVYEWVLK
jgi:hypothetical protein